MERIELRPVDRKMEKGISAVLRDFETVLPDYCTLKLRLEDMCYEVSAEVLSAADIELIQQEADAFGLRMVELDDDVPAVE